MKLFKQDRVNKILKAIKEINLPKNAKCEKCNEMHIKGKVWSIERHGADLEDRRVCYCKSCCPTKHDVVREINLDKNPYGIVGIDNKKPIKHFNKMTLNSSNMICEPKIPFDKEETIDKDIPNWRKKYLAKKAKEEKENSLVEIVENN